jgi:hypothetical protein
MYKIWQNFLLRDTPQVILDLMTPVSRLYHVGGGGEKKGGRTDRHTQILSIIPYTLYLMYLLLTARI